MCDVRNEVPRGGGAERDEELGTTWSGKRRRNIGELENDSKAEPIVGGDKEVGWAGVILHK